MLSPVRFIKYRLFDMAALLLYVAVICLVFFGTFHKGEAGKYLLIDSDRGRECYALKENRDIHLEGSVGKSVIRIQNGRAFFLHSDCPDGLCTGMPPISRGGEWAACLPNGVFISIGGFSEIDTAAY